MTAIGTVAAVVVAGIRGEWAELTASASDGLVELQDLLVSGPLPIDEEQLEQARSAVLDSLSGEQARTGAVEGAAIAIETLAGVILAVVILYFLLKDGSRIWSFLLVGATVAGILAALVALVASGPIVAPIVVVVVIVVNQIEGDVLAPMVLGRALSLHPGHPPRADRRDDPRRSDRCAAGRPRGSGGLGRDQGLERRCSRGTPRRGARRPGAFPRPSLTRGRQDRHRRGCGQAVAALPLGALRADERSVVWLSRWIPGRSRRPIRWSS